MKKILQYITIFLLIFSVGCDNDFEEYNENVDDPVVVPSSKLIGTALRGSMNELYSTFNGSAMGENWAQHQSLIQYNSEDLYLPRVTSMDNLWARLYYAASDAHQMKNLAELEGNSTNMGVALILRSFCYQWLTDLFGYVPYTEALLGSESGIFQPAYDDQQTVYNGILADLDTAIAYLDEGNGVIDPNMDILYDGDASKWYKFAHSLKFKCLMRISGKADVGTDLQNLVNGGNLFTGLDDEAKLQYLSDSPEANPIYETIVAGGRNEHGMSATLIDKLKEFNDPRLDVYAKPAAASGEYVGKPNGFRESPLGGFGYDDVSAIGDFYLDAELPGYLFGYTEMLFMMAEAAQTGLISGDAKSYYDMAIASSFLENGLEGAAEYGTIAGVNFGGGNELEQIGTQKWIALFCQGFEAWTEWRRTGYPALNAAEENYTGDAIPGRLKYGSSEVSVNATNYNSAVSAQGVDEITTPVWWMN